MNVFLTGQINCGKSTIINNFLEGYNGKAAGYRTIRAKTHLDDFFGVYLLDINDIKKDMNKKNRAGTCFADKSLVCHENIFNTLGVKMLEGYSQADIVIMDEIGALEKDCTLFLDKISEVLDSEANVMGVIKQKDTLFLNEIKLRADVKIIEITGRNNKEALEEVKRLFYL